MMNKRKALFGIVLSAFVGLSSSMALAHGHFDQVEIKTIKVAPGIYMLMGEGGNIGVSAGDDGVFLIDDQYAPLTEKIKKAIAGITQKPIRFVLNTHWHPDHTGGNENLGRDGVDVIAHENVRKTMSVDQPLKAFNVTVPAARKEALPVITYNDRATFHLNDENIQIIHHQPSHTDGDSFVIFEKANVIHTGDTFFNGRYPFIDWQHGGSIGGMIKAADKMLAIADDDTKIIPGHGPLATKADLQTFRDMLIDVEAAMKPLIEAGKTREEVIAAKPTEKFDAVWGKGFLTPDAFVGIVYDGMK